MKERGIIAIILSILSLNFASAYLGFSPSGFFSDPSIFIYLLVFLAFFAVIHFAMARVFHQRATAAVIAFCVSALGVYGLNMVGFNLENLLFNLGINENNLAIILPIFILIFLVIISIKKDKITGKRKFLWHKPFIILGMLFIIVGMTDWVYQKVFSIIFGAGLFILGLLILGRKLRKDKRAENKATRKGWNLFKRQEDYKNDLKNKTPKLNEKTPKGTSEEDKIKGINTLIAEAQMFKKTILTSRQTKNNPKFYGSWAMFVRYMINRGWGKNERKICEHLKISQKDFVKIFNRYGKV